MIPAMFVYGVAQGVIEVEDDSREFVELYEGYVKSYLIGEIQRIFSATRSDLQTNREFTHSIEFKTTSEKHAFAKSEIDSDRRLKITISLGLFHALQDCCLRAFSAQEFFNDLDALAKGEGQYWRGGKTLELGDMTDEKPNARYFDYALEALPSPIRLDWQEEFSKVGVYIKKIPLDDERVQAARIALDIGLFFLFLHEENHFILGHLDYIEDYFSSRELDEFSFLLEHDDSPFTELEPEISKVFEWQADRQAVRDVMSFWRGVDLQELLPDYAKNSSPWRVHLVTSAIGLVMLVLDRARLQLGDAEGYPPVRVRFCSSIQAISAELLHGELLPVLRDNGSEVFISTLLEHIQAIGNAIYDVSIAREMINEDEPLNSEDQDPIVRERKGALVAGVIYVVDGLIDLAGDKGAEFRNTMEIVRQKSLDLIAATFTEDGERHSGSLDALVAEAQSTLAEHRAFLDLNSSRFWSELEPYRAL